MVNLGERVAELQICSRSELLVDDLSNGSGDQPYSEIYQNLFSNAPVARKRAEKNLETLRKLVHK